MSPGHVETTPALPLTRPIKDFTPMACHDVLQEPNATKHASVNFTDVENHVLHRRLLSLPTYESSLKATEGIVQDKAGFLRAFRGQSGQPTPGDDVSNSMLTTTAPLFES